MKPVEDLHLTFNPNIGLFFGMGPHSACPVGCDPDRNRTAISRPGRQKVRKFVAVYYKKRFNLMFSSQSD